MEEMKIDESLPMEEKQALYEAKALKVKEKDTDAEKNTQSHRPEKLHFMLKYNTAFMDVCVYNPDAYAIAQFAEDAPLELAYTVIHGVLVVAAKVGGMEWIHDISPVDLSVNAPQPCDCDFSDPKSLSHMTLHVALSDYKYGTQVAMKSVELPEAFATKLITTITEQVGIETAGIEEEDQFPYTEELIHSTKTEDILKAAIDHITL